MEYFRKTNPKQEYSISLHFNKNYSDISFVVLRNIKGMYDRNPSAFRPARNLKLITFQQMIALDNSDYEN